MQFKVFAVVDHCLGGRFEERFAVIGPHFGMNWLLWVSIYVAEDENKSNNKSLRTLNTAKCEVE